MKTTDRITCAHCGALLFLVTRDWQRHKTTIQVSAVRHPPALPGMLGTVTVTCAACAKSTDVAVERLQIVPPRSRPH